MPASTRPHPVQVPQHPRGREATLLASAPSGGSVAAVDAARARSLATSKSGPSFFWKTSHVPGPEIRRPAEASYWATEQPGVITFATAAVRANGGAGYGHSALDKDMSEVGQAGSPTTVAPSYFHGERLELQSLAGESSLSRHFESMSRLPALSKTDPRSLFAGVPPSCYQDLSMPRSERIVDRWNSVHRTRRQLPPQHLRVIESAAAAPLLRARGGGSVGSAMASSQGLGSLSALRHAQLEAPPPPSPGPEQRRASPDERRRASKDKAPALKRQNTEAKLIRIISDLVPPDSGAKHAFCQNYSQPKRDKPHIPCSCCEHMGEKEWKIKARSRQPSKEPVGGDDSRAIPPPPPPPKP